MPSLVSWRRVWLIAGLAVISVGASDASGAAAPGWFAAHTEADQQAIVDYVYDRAPQGVVPYGGAPATTGQQLADLAAVADSHEYPLLPEFADQEFKLLTRSGGLLPDVATGIPSLYPAAAAVGAFAAGWQIGTGLRSIFAEVWSPDASAVGGSFTWDQLYWAPYSTEIYYGARVEQQPGAYLYGGWLNGTRFNPVRWFESPCGFSGYSGPPAASLQTNVASTARCVIPNTFPPEEAEVFVDYPYLLPSQLGPREPVHRYDEARDGRPDVVSPAPADPGLATTRPAIAAALDGDGQDYTRAFIDWAQEPDHQSEEDPRKIGVPPKVAVKDRPCVPSGSGPAPDPGDSKPATSVVTTFTNVLNPATGKNVSVKLYWGTDGWGYRHIVIDHGWTAKDAADTALALKDRSPTVNGPTSWRYYYTYTGSDGVTQCYRRVVVEYKANRGFPFPRHIITSFAGAGVKR